MGDPLLALLCTLKGVCGILCWNIGSHQETRTDQSFQLLRIVSVTTLSIIDSDFLYPGTKVF